MDNVFFQTVMGSFAKRDGDISYPQLNNVHLGKTELLSEYYSRVFLGNDFCKIAQNCVCHVSAHMEQGVLENASITALYVKGTVIEKADESSFWTYLRFDVDAFDVPDLSSHFFPHMHFIIQRGGERFPEEYRMLTNGLSKKIIYDCLSTAFRMANHHEWMKFRNSVASDCCFTEVKNIYDNNIKRDVNIGKRILSDDSFRKMIIRYNDRINQALLLQNIAIDIPVSEKLKDCCKIY